MAAIDEIKNMYAEGKSDEEIKSSLRQRGFSETELSALLSQAKIKEAVSGTIEDQSQSPFQFNSAIGGENGEMYPSIMQPEQEQGQEAPQEYPQYEMQYPESISSQGQYPESYQPYQSSISPETITEIAEQIAIEKLSPISTKIEKLASSKTASESKIQNIQERLERIEKIIDKLQLSIIQKVGDYMNDVSDLKKELIETQKSFKAIHKKTHGHHP